IKDVEKRKKEQNKFGIFFDDDYDYLQHLRAPGDREVHWEYVESANRKHEKSDRTDFKPNLQLPSSVFASEFEEEEGMLRKAAPRSGPRPDLDPDIVAALDDDFDFDNPDNEFGDDFIAEIMGGEDVEDEEYDEDEGDDEKSYGSDFEVDEHGDGLGPMRTFNDEECKSRFTEYSMSSSVIRRNEQLALLDERFEKFYENYDEPELGALDCEEIEGEVNINDDLLNQCWVEFKRNDECEEYNKEWDVERIKKLQEEDSLDEDLVEMEVDDGKKKWDCESILSTYSNLYNHPKLIDEPRRRSKITINPKTGVPNNVFNGENKQLTMKSLAKFNIESSVQDTLPSGPKSLCAQSVLSTLSVLSIRPKDETPEEKRERKRLLKEYRFERRVERKANTLAFKEEKKVQEKIKINNRNNAQRIV
ncbi:Protein LTV1 like, partial [Pseudolycoriella hygida]